MRTLPVVLAVVLVNDAVLLAALDVAVPPWLFVVGGAVALSATILAVVGAGVDEDEPLSRAELQANLTALRERVDELEATERGND